MMDRGSVLGQVELRQGHRVSSFCMILLLGLLYDDASAVCSVRALRPMNSMRAR